MECCFCCHQRGVLCGALKNSQQRATRDLILFCLWIYQNRTAHGSIPISKDAKKEQRPLKFSPARHNSTAHGSIPISKGAKEEQRPLKSFTRTRTIVLLPPGRAFQGFPVLGTAEHAAGSAQSQFGFGLFFFYGREWLAPCHVFSPL
jgi:hypothetical protein